MKVLAALLALMSGPSNHQVATDSYPAGDALSVEEMAASTAHPFWRLEPSEVARFDQLAACESGSQWDLHVGPFDGGIQFLPSTWRAVGGEGEAWQASREEQIWRGHLLLEQTGWRSWPGCARKFGWLN